MKNRILTLNIFFLFWEQTTLGPTSKSTKQRPTEDVNIELTENTNSPATIPPASGTTTTEATTTTSKAKESSINVKINHSFITCRAPLGLHVRPYMALIIAIFVIWATIQEKGVKEVEK